MASSWQAQLDINVNTAGYGVQFNAVVLANPARALGHNGTETWREAVDAWSDQPYYGPKTQWRLARALTENDPLSAEAVELLDAIAATRQKVAQ